jgi:hypothetical protein
MKILDKPAGITINQFITDYKKNNQEINKLCFAGRLDPMARGKVMLLFNDECKQIDKIPTGTCTRIGGYAISCTGSKRLNCTSGSISGPIRRNNLPVVGCRCGKCAGCPSQNIAYVRAVNQVRWRIIRAEKDFVAGWITSGDGSSPGEISPSGIYSGLTIGWGRILGTSGGHTGRCCGRKCVNGVTTQCVTITIGRDYPPIISGIGT